MWVICESFGDIRRQGIVPSDSQIVDRCFAGRISDVNIAITVQLYATIEENTYLYVCDMIAVSLRIFASFRTISIVCIVNIRKLTTVDLKIVSVDHDTIILNICRSGVYAMCIIVVRSTRID